MSYINTALNHQQTEYLNMLVKQNK